MPPTQLMLHAHAMAADAIRRAGHAHTMAGNASAPAQKPKPNEITVTDEMIEAGRNAFNDCADWDTGAVVMVQAVYHAMAAIAPVAPTWDEIGALCIERDAARAELAEETKLREHWRDRAFGEAKECQALEARLSSACDLIRWQADRLTELTVAIPDPAPTESPLLRATRSGNRQIIGIPLP